MIYIEVVYLDNVFVRFYDLPTTIKSYVVANNDGSFTIILNGKVSHEVQLLSYLHELEHIKKGDYDKKNSIDIIEIYAHRVDGFNSLESD